MPSQGTLILLAMRTERLATVRQWCLLGVFNLVLVAILGTLMRIQHVLPLDTFSLVNVLHAHSHFAFLGWVSGMLMLLITTVCFQLKKNDYLPLHQERLLLAHMLVSYAMLFSFLCSGYSLTSIILSTISVLISFGYVGYSWRDLRRQAVERGVKRWFCAGFVFLVLSSIGTFYLAGLMASKQALPAQQIASIYFYLHFQYNGWFFFGLMGLLHHLLNSKNIVVKQSKAVFMVFFISAFPAYLLSVLWMPMPGLLRGLAVTAAVIPLIAGIFFLVQIVGHSKLLLGDNSRALKIVWGAVGLSALLKFTLQAISTIPSLEHLVFGYRPIMVAYLHLVLLMIVSIFLLLCLFQWGYLSNIRSTRYWFFIFFGAVVGNQIVLSAQASSGIGALGMSAAPSLLIIVSIIILVGILGVFFTQILLPDRPLQTIHE